MLRNEALIRRPPTILHELHESEEELGDAGEGGPLLCVGVFSSMHLYVSQGCGDLKTTFEGVSMLIAKIDKNQKEKYHVSVEEFRGSRFIDCRVYFEDEDGVWIPTRKGVALNDESIGPVIRALQKAQKALER